MRLELRRRGSGSSNRGGWLVGARLPFPTLFRAEASGPTLLGLALVVLGFALRLKGIGDHWLNPDEGIYYSTLTWSSWRAFWSEVMANAHPPAFYLILREAGALTRDFVLLRAVPLLGGTMAVWLFWLLGRELGGPGRAGTVAGAVAAGLLAVDAEAILLSQVLRPYMLLVPLLAAALLCLLRYRAAPSAGRLAAYVGITALALLTHYAAVLAFGVFLVLFLADYRWGTFEPRERRRLLLAQGGLAVLVGLLFAAHLRPAMGSYMLNQALAPGGWLSEWLAGSFGDGWRGIVAFQVYHLPPEWQGRAAVLMLCSLGGAALLRERVPALLGLGALAIALMASFAGLYPLGPTRHSAWLVVFTLPVLGWMFGRLAVARRSASLGAAGALALMMILGGRLERVLGAPMAVGNGADEQAVRRAELEPVLRLMDRDAGPPLVLMSFQAFNFLMPLYSAERQTLLAGSSPELFAFAYGSRRVAVLGQWSWEGADQLRQTLGTLASRFPDVPAASMDRVLVVSGGWDAVLLRSLPELRAAGAMGAPVTVYGRDGQGERIARVTALVLDVEALLPSQAPADPR